MNRTHPAAIIALLFLPLLPVPAPATAQQAHLERFMLWFQGEFNNYEQVWQQKQDGDERLLQHIHSVFRPVTVPALGENVFFAEQYLDGNYDKLYRRRLYRLSLDAGEDAIRLGIWSFMDGMRFGTTDGRTDLPDIPDKNRLRTNPGCDILWKWNGEYFQGDMKEKACSRVSEALDKKVYISGSLRLTDSWFWMREQVHDAHGRLISGSDTPLKSRKARLYKGWMSLKKHRVDPHADPGDWIFARIGKMHNEGQQIPLLDESGNRTGYTLSLETLTYQNTRVPILKVGVIDDSAGYTLSYSWAEPASRRVGINVRWFQAGLTRIDD